jgi:hypothetical protein
VLPWVSELSPVAPSVTGVACCGPLTSDTKTVVHCETLYHNGIGSISSSCLRDIDGLHITDLLGQ